MIHYLHKYPCKYCGSFPMINDDKGIGDIMCSNNSCRILRPKHNAHFSGKFCTKKRDALKEWIELNQKGD